jgi:transcriptional regulator with XRE-family HTH domain
MTTTLARPTPVGTKDHKKPGWAGKGKVVSIVVYDGREVAAYRAARGVTQDAVAQRLHVAQSLVARYESGKPGVDLQEKQAVAMLDAIDFLAAKRERMRAEGLAELEAIRFARLSPATQRIRRRPA